MKILFCSTSASLTTGYAKISAQILNNLAQFHDVWHLAFQSNNLDNIDRKIDPRITVIPDELFGVDKILEYIEDIKPDYVVVYNDVIVCSHYSNKFRNLLNKDFKIFMYLDLTYEYQNWVKDISESCDLLICFHKTWMKHVIDLGVPREKVTYIDHPHPKNLEISYQNIFKFSQDDFVILNLNRNSYRKLNDISIDGFIKFFKQNNCSPRIKLFLGCKFGFEGCYQIDKLIECFSKIHGLTPSEYDILVNNSILRLATDSASDETIHQLYQSCDVGINTCGGEGYGLCNIEHQLYGKPQIVTGIKNFYEFFSPISTYFIQPRARMWITKSLDHVGGLLEIPSADDLAEGLQFYYDNPGVRLDHGVRGKKFLENRPNNFKNWLDLF